MGRAIAPRMRLSKETLSSERWRVRLSLYLQHRLFKWLVCRRASRIYVQSPARMSARGFDCKSVQTSGSDLAFLCLPRLEKLCTPCTSELQCTGGACLTVDGEGRCGYACQEDSDCPSGYGCLEDNSGAELGTFCQPLTGSCTCVSDFDGGQRSCSISGDLGTCYGVGRVTERRVWGGCSALPQRRVMGKFDNDCNGLIDDALGRSACENVVDGVGSCGVFGCFDPRGWVSGTLPRLRSVITRTTIVTVTLMRTSRTTRATGPSTIFVADVP